MKQMNVSMQYSMQYSYPQPIPAFGLGYLGLPAQQYLSTESIPVQSPPEKLP